MTSMIKPAFIFTDNAILQCDMPLAIRGESDAKSVSKALTSQAISTTLKHIGNTEINTYITAKTKENYHARIYS